MIMKRKVLSAMLATAFAAVATTASAGVIQASFKNYASEVFGTNAVVLTAPTINYALALPLSGTIANPNNFSISWTLTTGGTFTVAPAVGTISLSTPSNTLIINPTSVTLNTAGTVLTANFTVTDNYTVGSQIVLGSGGPVNITNVGTILGAPALTNGCGNDLASVNVAVRLTNAAGVEFDSNFTLAPLSNTTPIVQSQVALSVLARDSGAFVGLDELGRVDVLIPSLGQFFTVDTDVTGASNVLLNIGSVSVTTRTPVLFDLDGLGRYTASSTLAQGLFGTNPNTGIGAVEANSLAINVSGNFLNTAAGGSFFASTSAACASVLEAGSIATNGLSATVTLSAADVASLGASGVAPLPVYMCYQVAGTSVIPTGQFAVTGGSLGKYANSLEAANPVCPAPVYNLLSNGVRVDVRNYVPQVSRVASGWYSVVRVINTDEVQSVSPVVQALLANGTLGASASLGTVASTDNKTGAFLPREVRYYTSTAIDAVLSAAAITQARPTFSAPADVGGNARLRISAASSSIRVQNYVFNGGTGAFFEASSAQGDDGPDYSRRASATDK